MSRLQPPEHGDEEATMATLSAHRALSTSSSPGIEVGSRTQPSIACSPNSRADAARFAIEIQAALQRANEDEPEGRGMRFRIGVNVGDVMVKDGDIFGDGVNVAARLEGWNIAQRSGRFASASVRLGPSKRFRPRGNHRATRIDFCSGGHLRAVSRQRGRPRARALGQRQRRQSWRAGILHRALSGGYLRVAR